MPLLKDGRIQSSEVQLPVAATLPAGYLCQDSRKVDFHFSHKSEEKTQVKFICDMCEVSKNVYL